MSWHYLSNMVVVLLLISLAWSEVRVEMALALMDFQRIIGVKKIWNNLFLVQGPWGNYLNSIKKLPWRWFLSLSRWCGINSWHFNRCLSMTSSTSGRRFSRGSFWTFRINRLIMIVIFGQCGFRWRIRIFRSTSLGFILFWLQHFFPFLFQLFQTV